MSTPDIDPYGVLGVANDATITEIRAAHRKRVLKCHPDKIQDVSQRNAAQDEFQKVQQAYELLSDDLRRRKHDEKVKIAELKRKIAESKRTDPAYNSPRANNREFRNGHIVEERVPMEVYFEEAMRFTEEPRPMSRKYTEEYGVRTKPKTPAAEEKKKPRTPLGSDRAAKEKRDSAKATHSDRAKTRDQERRRQTEAKFEANYAESDDASDSSAMNYRYHTRPSTTPRREREERESRSRPEHPRRRERRYEDDGNLSDHWKTKIETTTFSAEDYIASNKGRTKSPRAYRGYDSPEIDSSSSRSERRPARSSSRNNSYENMGTPKSYEVKTPKMPSATTTPGIKAHLRPFMPTRSHTTSAGYVRPKLETRESRKSRDSTLYDMAHEPTPASRTSKMRDRTDSGYSSPNTPELPRGTSPKTSQRYSILEEPERRVVEPKSSKYRSGSARSPDRERSTPTRATPKRSSTYQAYESSPRAERERSSRTSRPYEVRYIRPKEKEPKFPGAYEPDVPSYSTRRPYEEEYHRITPDRRQSVR
ncbi:unnamed protein product [Penicillium olsonii]|nr:unnamed protein product [Penicillium olsonii]CAG7923944.1 unnamed protein product [Penicillium olsonii]